MRQTTDKDKIIKDLCCRAKLSGNFLKEITKNRTYTGPWCARLADIFCSLKRTFDCMSAIDEITKAFHKHCETPIPTSKGICFNDTYVDDD